MNKTKIYKKFCKYYAKIVDNKKIKVYYMRIKSGNAFEIIRLKNF